MTVQTEGQLFKEKQYKYIVKQTKFYRSDLIVNKVSIVQIAIPYPL